MIPHTTRANANSQFAGVEESVYSEDLGIAFPGNVDICVLIILPLLIVLLLWYNILKQ